MKTNFKYNWSKYIWQIGIFWTLVIITSSYWNISNISKTTLHDARLQAIVAFDKDVQYRRWNAIHGGVYVPVSEYGKPNPSLQGLVKRDIITQDGDTLTMINPAYMTRQVHESELSDINVLGHITSLNLLRPENAADEWETAALQGFKAGLKEFSSIEMIDSIKYFRFMKPLLTEKSCLKCHEQQGYKIGEVRGGISVSIPMETMLQNTYAEMRKHAAWEGLIWLIGLAGIVIGYKTTRRNEERFRILTKLFPAGIYITDLKGKCIYVNDRWCEMAGITLDEAVGDGWIKAIHPDDREKVFSYWDKMVKSGGKWGREYRFQTPGGKVSWVNGVVKPLIEDGKITGFVGLNTFITDRKQAEQLQSVVYQISKATNSSKSLNELYKSIYLSLGQVLDVTNFYIAYYDENVNLLSFPFYLDTQDTAPASARPLGRGLTEYIMKTGQPLLLSKKKIEGYARKGEIDVVGTLPELWMGAPLKVGTRVIGAVAVNSYVDPDLYTESDLKILTFVSEQIAQTIEFKQAEARLKSSERTHRLLSEQLTQANLLKETLLDVISHDLKNPAGVILGFSELLEEGKGDNEIVTGIRDSSKNLIQVIDNVSTLSKVTLGENIELKLFDLVPLIEQISKEYESQLINKGMQMTLDLPDSLKVHANPIIAEVFKNYLSNALKYAADGKQLIIKAAAKADMVSINFIDRGATIPQEQRMIIFKRGYQLEDEEKKGRGLGLAIVKQIADAHQAEVGVLPNKPKGNIFYLKIPVK